MHKGDKVKVIIIYMVIVLGIILAAAYVDQQEQLREEYRLDVIEGNQY